LIACSDCNPTLICGENGHLCGLIACSDCNPTLICGVGDYKCGLIACSDCNPTLICGVNGHLCGLIACSDCNPTLVCGVGDYKCGLIACSDCNPNLIIIRNDTEKAVSTRGMYLSNDEDDLFMWQMPAVIIRAKQKLQINTNTKRTRINFELQAGKRIRLIDAAGNVVSMSG
jgi:hypothetical protein